MRGQKSALVVLLTEAELQQLGAWSRSTTTAVGLVRRANVILGVHHGLSVKEAAHQAGLSETHARKWLKRFLQQRLQGLHDAPRPGRPVSFSPTLRHTFLTKRFDRTATGQRIHFASAMTLLDRRDGDDASTGASYLELAEFLMKNGAHPDRDLEQLWRRIVFTICVSNADDHLRNHGFLLEQEGWVLSPAYDMNPDPYADGLKLNISDVENAQDLGLALEVADYFRVNAKRARAIIEEVVACVKGWRPLAETLKIASEEIERMTPAFRIVETA